MEYLLKSSAILSLFYLLYKIFIQNETFFNSIRFYFLMGFVSALVIPIVVITKYVIVQSVNFTNVNFVNNSSTFLNPAFDWKKIIFIIYIIGVVFFTSRFLIQLVSLIRYINKFPKVKKEKYYMISTDQKIVPFSFFNYIVYNPEQFKKSELEQIIMHEKVHVNQLHSIDILLSHLALILHWFNPLIWLYHKEIQKNLEFIADQLTLNISQEKAKYQHLLLKTVSSNYKMALTNNFYNSLLKKRINMLQRDRSKTKMYLKFALIIPILIAFVLTFNTRVIAQQNIKKTIEIQSDYDVELITKDFTKRQFEMLKSNYAKKGITFKYKKLKYNSKSEITSIEVFIKNKKGNQSNLSQNGTDPIKPIQIKINNETGAMYIGNSNTSSESSLFFTSGSGNEKVNISNIWISKEGDTTQIKKIKIDKDNQHNLVVTSGNDTDEQNVFVLKTDAESAHLSHGNMMFNGSEGENPLFIVDGKEIKNEKIKNISPNIIESISVLKGEAAIKQYGEKAKGGVVEIKTKN